MMRWTLGIALHVAFAGCGDGGSGASTEGQGTAALRDVPGRSPHPFHQFDQNVFHDTLLVQTSFDLGDGTFVMVASNVEETFEGLRLYRYRMKPDSTADVIAVSPPAYDSWTMLPTFFPLDTVHPDDANWVLANFGEKESWGQKAMLLDWDFMDVGFMDVALPERVMEDDTLRLKRRNVAPYMRYSEHGDTAVWLFACDSVYLYDDLEGQLDQVLHASRLRYTFEANEGLSLWVDGRKRTVKRPS
jgi:hypothetical protein